MLEHTGPDPAPAGDSSPLPGSAPRSFSPAQASGTTAVDPRELERVGAELENASALVSDGLAAYESIPMDVLAVALGPVGGEFLAAFDAATTRHRQLLAHTGRCVGAAGQLCRACANAFEGVDDSAAGSLNAADATGAGEMKV